MNPELHNAKLCAIGFLHGFQVVFYAGVVIMLYLIIILNAGVDASWLKAFLHLIVYALVFFVALQLVQGNAQGHIRSAWHWLKEAAPAAWYWLKEEIL